jgi:hypothetical protein
VETNYKKRTGGNNQKSALRGTSEQQEIFEKYHVTLHQAPIERYGVIGNVFTVAQGGNEVI